MATPTSELVENVLKAADEEAKKFKTIGVLKDIDLAIDPGNLLAVDVNPIDEKAFRSNKEDYLKKLTRDNTQLLFNDLWKLPVQKVEDAVVVELPDPTTPLPREKPVPKAKPATRWEQYAQLKGIQNKKKGRKVWDEEQKKWVPRWGYGSKNDLKQDWLLEVPGSVDPNTDMFAKKRGEKRERTSKNELQRLKNIARGQKLKVAGEGLKPTANPSRNVVNKAIHIAKQSTASIGKFEEKLPKEPRAKNMGKRRKFEPVFGGLGKEKDREKHILDVILKKKPRMNITKATNREMVEQQQDGSKDDARKRQRVGKKGKGSNRALPKISRKGNKVRGKAKTSKKGRRR
ncbi:ribosome biogenesis regulatory protein homolog [Amphiura filiformis]|uniref:ribosome biogenesis regulatory protein homolog n=1 Tax=Amphiura filiformis TaxID=82378 RepID=UPI003B20CEC6